MRFLLILTFLIIPNLCLAASPPQTVEEAMAARPHEAMLIYNWLLNTQELRIHQMRGGEGNKVFVSNDGHNEYVFAADAKGKDTPLDDGMNEGSYNFNSPFTEPLLHFSKDILPWIVWGSSKTDPTTRDERLEYYMQDLTTGLMRAHDTPLKKIDPTKMSVEEQLMMGIFMDAIELSKSEVIYDYLDKKPNADLNGVKFYSGLREMIIKLEPIMNSKK